jgi:hypothetical protein
MLRLNISQNGSTHNLSLSQQEWTFSPGNSWETCVCHRIWCSDILNSDLLPSRVSLDGSERRATFRPYLDVIDNAILQAMNQTQFASVWELAKSVCISCAIVWLRLTWSFGFFVKHLHWHRYPPDRCATTNSNRIVKRIAQTLWVCTGQWLAKIYDIGWVVVLFEDKPWKNLSSSGSAPPERVKHMISQSTH